jgi:hypothetical protein
MAFLRIFRRGLVAVLLLSGLAASAQSPVSREYRIKAAFLFNFARFVEWPSGAPAPPGAPLRIGILGADPFGTALDDIVQGESIQGRPLRIVRSPRLADLRDCQIIFVSPTEAGRMNEIIADLRGTHALTVGDADAFATEGGMIGFYLEGNKVRFAIDVGAANRAGLRISSQLLRLGKIVDGPSGSGG